MKAIAFAALAVMALGTTADAKERNFCRYQETIWNHRLPDWPCNGLKGVKNVGTGVAHRNSAGQSGGGSGGGGGGGSGGDGEGGDRGCKGAGGGNCGIGLGNGGGNGTGNEGNGKGPGPGKEKDARPAKGRQ